MMSKKEKENKLQIQVPGWADFSMQLLTFTGPSALLEKTEPKDWGGARCSVEGWPSLQRAVG